MVARIRAVSLLGDPVLPRVYESWFPIILIDDSELRSISKRPTLRKYLADIWATRHFIYEDAIARNSVKNESLYLGRIWNVLEPLLNAAMYGIIFGVLLKTSRGIDNFIGYIVLGIMFFGFLADGLTKGTSVIRSSKNLVSAFQFPFGSLVIAQGIRSFFANITPALVGVIFALSFQLERGVGWTIILIIPLYFLIHVFSTGLMFFVARATAFIPDLRALITFIRRAWFYSSGVFFSFERFTSNPTVLRLVEFNPAYQFLEAVRGAVLYFEPPSLKVWGYLVATTLLTFFLGLIYFWRAEHHYADAK